MSANFPVADLRRVKFPYMLKVATFVVIKLKAFRRQFACSVIKVECCLVVVNKGFESGNVLFRILVNMHQHHG